MDLTFDMLLEERKKLDDAYWLRYFAASVMRQTHWATDGMFSGVVIPECVRIAQEMLDAIKRHESEGK